MPDSTATWACVEMGEDTALKEQRVKSSLSLSQKPVSYVQYKLQSSREKGVGYIVQAVVRLLGFGK